MLINIKNQELVMDHYTFKTDDKFKGFSVEDNLDKVLRNDKYVFVCKHHVSGGFRGIQAGVFGLDDKFYELKEEGVVRICRPNLSKGYSVAVYLLGFGSTNLTYKDWVQKLEEMGFEKHKPFSLEELADGIQKEESAEKPSH